MIVRSYPLACHEYRYKQYYSTLAGLDAQFISYEIIDNIQHGTDGMDFWEKLGEFIPPNPCLCKLFPDCVVEDYGKENNISIIYSSEVCADIKKYLKCISIQDDLGPESNLLTFKFCRQYAQLYGLFSIASNDSKKCVQFNKIKS